VSEKYYSTKYLTKYCQCMECVEHGYQKVYNEIEVVEGYLKYLLVPQVCMKFLNQMEKESRLRKFEGKWVTIF
jgi:hypothetical protein